MIRSRTLALVVAGLIVVTTVGLSQWVYVSYTSLPDRTVLATGPGDGAWHQLSHELIGTIRSRCRIDAVPIADTTEGALHNLRLLEDGEVDFALYLRGARRLQPAEDREPAVTPMLVGNLYTDLTLFLIRRDLYEAGTLRTPTDLRTENADGEPFRVAVGQPLTGEHGVAQVVLRHYFGEDRPFEELPWDYRRVEKAFRAGTLDAAFISAGCQAPVFAELLEHDGSCVVGRIPEVPAIVMRNVGLSEVEIPRGLFHFDGESIPAEPFTTVGTQTMLLAHEEVESQLVEEVTRILLSEEFVQQNALFELSRSGAEYARRNPEFPIHPGAMHVYEPHIEPLVDPEFMEATENMRSFAVSLLVAGFLAYQWYRRNREQRQEHRLEAYFAELLKIDRYSLKTAESDRDADRLRETLERIVRLRNEALAECSAKDFADDGAADGLLALCDTLLAGIRSELLRWELRQTVGQPKS